MESMVAIQTILSSSYADLANSKNQGISRGCQIMSNLPFVDDTGPSAEMKQKEKLTTVIEKGQVICLELKVMNTIVEQFWKCLAGINTIYFDKCDNKMSIDMSYK